MTCSGYQGCGQSNFSSLAVSLVDNRDCPTPGNCLLVRVYTNACVMFIVNFLALNSQHRCPPICMICNFGNFSNEMGVHDKPWHAKDGMPRHAMASHGIKLGAPGRRSAALFSEKTTPGEKLSAPARWIPPGGSIIIAKKTFSYCVHLR